MGISNVTIGEIQEAKERRIYYNNVLTSGEKLTDQELIESIILLVFTNEGTPREFEPRQVRYLIEKHTDYPHILTEGYERDKVFPSIL